LGAYFSVGFCLNKQKNLAEQYLVSLLLEGLHLLQIAVRETQGGNQLSNYWHHGDF